MSAEVFVDTNVFIYHLDATDPRKHAIAEKLIRAGLATGTACISFQVVQECLNVALRKAEVALSTEGARAYLDTVLAPLLQVSASATLYERALDIHARRRFGFYDSLIVAAALTAGCRLLLTEDLQHDQRIESLTIRNPFL
jgi:predicted nucleic acid-binding protein